MHNIAVIGAGMAGCMLARRLIDAGYVVHVFDKARAAGGRLATRAEGRLRFDHGAPFVSGGSAAAGARLDDWRRAGVIARWPAADHDGDACWTGVPGMNALAPRLLWGAELRLQTAVREMGADRLGWWLASDSETFSDCFDAVLLTLPAPQACALLQRCKGSEVTHFVDAVARIGYAPCWTIMVQLNARIDAPDCIRFPAGSILDMALRNSAKPMRDAICECWVIHASADWSERQAGASAETVAGALFDIFLCAVGAQTSEPVFLRAHHWKYARVTRPLGEPCLWDGQIRLGYASDGCLGARVDDALASAEALADRVLATTN